MTDRTTQNGGLLAVFRHLPSGASWILRPQIHNRFAQGLLRIGLKRLGDLRIDKAQERLHVLNQASERDLLSLQSLHYHRLHGLRRYSIDADSRHSKWRITFEWSHEHLKNVSLVRIEDTH